MRELTIDEQAKAIKGVLGMMRFADFDNPVLQTALGDLLSLQIGEAASPRLAAVAYELALMKTRDPVERVSLEVHASRILPSRDSKEERLKLLKALDTGLVAGRKLAEQIRTDEVVWIRERRDVDQEFERKYLSPVTPTFTAPVSR